MFRKSIFSNVFLFFIFCWKLVFDISESTHFSERTNEKPYMGYKGSFGYHIMERSSNKSTVSPHVSVTPTNASANSRQAILGEGENKLIIEPVYNYSGLYTNPACSGEGVANHPNWKFLPQQCGVARMKDRIIGGREAALGEFPWMIKMTFASKTVLPAIFVDVPILCAGGLISEYYVLTADHCTRNDEGTFVRSVVMGRNMLDTPPCPENICDGLTQIHDVAKVIQYSAVTFKNKGNQDTSQHDIALLKLKTRAQFNEFIQPICLPKGDFLDNPGSYIRVGEHLTVSGFGAIDKINHMITSRNRMMYAHLSIRDLQNCNRFPFSNFKRIDNTLICAGDPPTRDSCAGDSGSPVVMPLSIKGPPRYYLVGLVSFGLTKCADDYAVYVNVACYIKWILDNIQM